MVCTETYYQRVMGEEESGKGLGVRWEGNLIYGEIYRAGTMNTKFIPRIILVSGKKDSRATLGLREHCYFGKRESACLAFASPASAAFWYHSRALP